MGWQTPRQMGAAAVGRRSNHIHLVRFPVFPCSCFLQQLINRRRRPENLRSLLARRQFGKNTLTHTQYCRLALPEDQSSFVHVRPSTLLTTGGDGARKTFSGSLGPNICLPNFLPSGKTKVSPVTRSQMILLTFLYCPDIFFTGLLKIREVFFVPRFVFVVFFFF